MSKYHIKCTQTDGDVPKKKTKKAPAEPQAPPAPAPPPPPPPPPSLPPAPTPPPTPPAEPPKQDDAVLIASFNSNLPCCCEVVSRVLREDLPKVLGMSSRRAALQIGQDELLDCNPDIQFKEPSEPNTNEAETANCAKPPPNEE